MKPGDKVRLKRGCAFKNSDFDYSGVLIVADDSCIPHKFYVVRNCAGYQRVIYSEYIRKLYFWERIVYWFRQYYSPAARIKRLEKDISELEGQIGREYQNPLGTAFDAFDDQQDHDEVIAGMIERKKEKIEMLKKKI